MNYKKIGLLLVAASALVMAGCGNSAKNMTFNEVYTAFRDSHTSEGVELMNSLSEAPALGEEGHYVLSGTVSGGVAANIDISATSTVSNEAMNTESALSISGNLTQPGMNDTISLNSNILFKMVSGLSYINLSSLSLNSASGNPQISMIGAFSAMLTNKWISLASSGFDTTSVRGLNLSTLYTLPGVVVQSLENNPIFVETSKETVDGNPVYHVALSASGLYEVAKDVVSNDAIKSFLGATQFTDADLMSRAETFVANSQFAGKLTAYSKNDITLTIDNLRLDEMESIRGEISKKKTHFEVVNSAAGANDVIATFDVMPNGDNMDFALVAPAQQLNVKGSFDFDVDSLDSDNIGYMISVLATHPEFSFAVKGDIDVEKIDGAAITAPSSFQTIDQLVGGFRDLVGSGASSSMMDMPTADDQLMQ